MNPPSTKALGDVAEGRALAHLEAAGLVLVRRNYRVARGPSSRGGEVDLVMRERDGTLVFVEVRRRGDDRFGGAASTVVDVTVEPPRVLRQGAVTLDSW